MARLLYLDAQAGRERLGLKLLCAWRGQAALIDLGSARIILPALQDLERRRVTLPQHDGSKLSGRSIFRKHKGIIIYLKVVATASLLALINPTIGITREKGC